MPEIKKPNWIKEQIRRYLVGFQLISSLAMGVFVVAILLFALKYFNPALYTPEQIAKAQKIGNWEFPDGNYALVNLENFSLENKDIFTAAVKDKTSGNTILIFSVNFSQAEMLRIKDSVQNKLLEKYNLASPFLKVSGNKTGRLGEEFVYSTVGWNSKDGAKAGFVGSLDCLKNKNNGINIIAVAYNASAKYNEARALNFVNTLKCPADTGNGGGDVGLGDKADIDNDGLTDKVEKMLKTDPYKKDTDDDGLNDFEEIQTGHSPLLPRPWDKYTPEELDKVKRDIKYVSIDVYDKLFPEK